MFGKNKALKPLKNYLKSIEKVQKHLLGTYDRKEFGLPLTNSSNVLVIGTESTGKSYNYAVTNILNGQESVIVIDYLGTIGRQCIPTLQSNGYACHTISLHKTSTKDELENDEAEILSENTVGITADELLSQKTAVFIDFPLANRVSDDEAVRIAFLLNRLFDYFVLSVKHNSQNANFGVRIYVDDILDIPNLEGIQEITSVSNCKNLNFSFLSKDIGALENKYGFGFSKLMSVIDAMLITGDFSNQKLCSTFVDTAGKEMGCEINSDADRKRLDSSSADNVAVYIRNDPNLYICDRLEPSSYISKKKG